MWDNIGPVYHYRELFIKNAHCHVDGVKVIAKNWVAEFFFQKAQTRNWWAWCDSFKKRRQKNAMYASTSNQWAHQSSQCVSGTAVNHGQSCHGLSLCAVVPAFAAR